MPLLSTTLESSVAGIRFASPLLNASGAFNAHLFNELFALNTALGGIVTKTVTEEPKIGNIQPRTVELPGIGMLNSIGLQNPGLTYTLEKELSQLANYEIPIILSISAHSSADFAKMAEAVLSHPQGAHVAALEMNLSCPNVEQGGIHFGTSAESVKSAVQAVKQVFKKPVFAKLTPNVTDIVSIGGAALEGGADGLTAINTLLGVAIDIKKRKPVMPRVSAGYSGPGIKPVALHAVWNLAKHFPQAPIMAVGGISTTEDVLEFLMAGASLVQVGTSCFRRPTVFAQISEQLHTWCETEGITSITELRGCAQANL